MWAHQLCAPFTFEAVEVPSLREADLLVGQVLLATSAGGICGSDLPNFRGAGFAHPADIGDLITTVPGFPLHEVVGSVVASRHPAHQVGDQVVGWASGFDGIAELVITDGEGLLAYDRLWKPEVAVLLQPLACVLYAVEQLADVRGRDVAVVGQGPIGLLFSHVLKQAGASRVVGVDRINRSDVATSFGVDETVTASAARWASHLRDPDRPSIVVEAVGHQVTTMGSCLEAAAFGGEIFYFGIPDDLVYPFDMMKFLRKNLTLRSGATHDRRRVLADARSYLAAHPDLADGYITHVHPVDDVESAFTAAANPGPGQHKVALTMP